MKRKFVIALKHEAFTKQKALQTGKFFSHELLLGKTLFAQEVNHLCLELRHQHFGCNATKPDINRKKGPRL